MKIRETVFTSLKALNTNKVRTFLTMIGVVIGVFAVVSLISLVKGLKNYVEDQFEVLGSSVLFVMPGSAGLANDPSMSFSNNRLAKKHVDLIKAEGKDFVEFITPSVFSGKTVKFKNKSYYASINGGTSDFIKIFNIEMEKGRFFGPSEDRTKAKVAVLGSSVNANLFGAVNSVGKKIKVEDTYLEVIGVFKQKGPDYDEAITIPLSTTEDILQIKNYTYINVKTKSGTNMDLAAARVEAILLGDLKSDEFTIFTQSELLKTFQSILGVLTIGLGAVASISLLVGGIGIMNIMLVSVTERIREIGLRKALGATSFDIGLQFLIESVVISVFGGFLGLFFGWISTFAVQQWIRAEVPFWVIALAFGFSAFVGVVFGTYPAIRASKLDPIEALRYE